jgi:hypothetical protein
MRHKNAPQHFTRGSLRNTRMIVTFLQKLRSAYSLRQLITVTDGRVGCRRTSSELLDPGSLQRLWQQGRELVVDDVPNNYLVQVRLPRPGNVPDSVVTFAPHLGFCQLRRAQYLKIDRVIRCVTIIRISSARSATCASATELMFSPALKRHKQIHVFANLRELERQIEPRKIGIRRWQFDRRAL